MTPFIDTHVHLWNPSLLPYPWLKEVPSLQRAFEPDDLDPSPDGVIVVEAGCADALAELRWIETLAQTYPNILGMVAHVPVELGRDVELQNHRLVVGARRNLQDEPAGFMDRPEVRAGIAALADAGLPFDACVREHQIPELTRLVDACPDATFVLDHLGKPGIRQQRWEPWLTDIRDLARRPNVCAKLSGLATEADHDNWQPVILRPYLDHAISLFTPQRCMFGSDWPVMTLATDYASWAELVSAALGDLTPSEQTAIGHGTAKRVYRLPT